MRQRATRLTSIGHPGGRLVWLRLIQEAEQAARDAGASLWYVPPAGYADTVTVNSDGSGGRPALGTGPVGRVLSRGTEGNNATQSTSANRPILVAAPGAAAAAAGFGALSHSTVSSIAAAPSAFSNNETAIVGYAPASVGFNEQLTRYSAGRGFLIRSDSGPSTSILSGSAGGYRFSPVLSSPAVMQHQVLSIVGGTVARVNGSDVFTFAAGYLSAASGNIVSGNNGAGNAGGVQSGFAFFPNGGTAQQVAAVERLFAFIGGSSYPGL